MGDLILKPGREKPIRRRHPWVFSGAVGEVRGQPAEGETVEIYAATGDFLARGAFSPKSQIRSRIWTWDQAQVVDREFFRLRLENAISARENLADIGETNAFRLVHAESDGLPGLVVDRYNDQLVVQFLSSGADTWRTTLVELLDEISSPKTIYERSDVEVRSLEGLPARTGLLRGESQAERFEILELGLKFLVDVQRGQKTGFYLDQRPNRALVRQLAQGKSVLNCFAYTGGFTIAALAGGASEVLSVETSFEAIELGKANLELNQMGGRQTEWLQEDVFSAMRGLRDQARSFDLVVLDPPKFAPTKAHVQRAARGYKDINLLAFKLLNRGGLLVTFSCSGGLDAPLFQKIIADAALDAGVNAQILTQLGAGSDHPVALNFPEGAYLKGFVCRVS
jgi:23S rRNA (cytosine1962-C5)-methyltransferase